MNKVRNICFTAVFAGITAIGAHAQFFIGGSLGVDFDASSRIASLATTKQPSSFAFEISPLAGYSLTDRFSAGLRVAVGIRIGNNRADTPTKTYTYSWGITPLVRNTLIQADKFSLLLESSVFVTGSMIKQSAGATVTDGARLFGFGVWALPVLQFSVTDRFSLEARSNIVSLGYLKTTTKDNPTADAPKTAKSTFGFGVNSGSRNMTSAFEIGMIVKF